MAIKPHDQESFRWVEPRPGYMHESEPGSPAFKSIPLVIQPDPVTVAENKKLAETLDRTHRRERKRAQPAPRADDRKLA
jgi:hypothetical protein